MDQLQSAAVALVFVIAGAVKGVTGMGLPTVAVSLLGLWMSPSAAAVLLVIPSLATNVAQCLGPHGRSLLRRLWPAWLGLAAATLWSPSLPVGGSIVSARTLLGIVLVGYGLWGLLRPALPDLSATSRWIALFVGLATGAVTATTAVFVVPLVPYLQSLRLDKDETVQALGLSFTVATVALALRLQAGDEATWVSTEVGVALLAAFIGLWFGRHVRVRLSGPAFQRALAIVFVGLGVANLLRAV